MSARAALPYVALWFAAFGCADDPYDRGALRYATEVAWFEPGAGAGYGARSMPGAVLGAPGPGGPARGSIEVLSLGIGGAIALGFSGGVIVDGPGDDFVVYENPFRYGPGGASLFSEPGEVAVSEDGELWTVLPCEPATGAGCAGFEPLGERGGGGDRFDLGSFGVRSARYVRITDRSSGAAVGPTAGFDLDALEVLAPEGGASPR